MISRLLACRVNGVEDGRILNLLVRGPMKAMKKFVKDNALLIAFAILFVLCLAGQVFSGKTLYDETQSAHGLPRVGYARYVRTGDFLQGIFSNWQAAVLQLGSLILFGVVLHQKGTPHSLKDGNQGRAVGKKRTPSSSWLKRNGLSVAFGLMFVTTFVGHWLSGSAAYNSELALLHQPQVSVFDVADVGGRVRSDCIVCIFVYLSTAGGVAGVQAYECLRR
jgi:hypothetical protein